MKELYGMFVNMEGSNPDLTNEEVKEEITNENPDSKDEPRTQNPLSHDFDNMSKDAPLNDTHYLEGSVKNIQKQYYGVKLP
jgi:hypothetical protein